MCEELDAARRFFRVGCTYYSVPPVVRSDTPQTECYENFLPSADFSKFNYIYCSGCMNHARRTNHSARSMAGRITKPNRQRQCEEFTETT